MQPELAPTAYWAGVNGAHGRVLLKVKEVVNVSRDEGHVLYLLVLSVGTLQRAGVFREERRVVFALDEGRRVHYAAQVAEVVLQSRNLELVQDAAHTLDGVLARNGPYDELTYHRVVIEGYFVTLVDVAVDAHAYAVRLYELADDARTGDKTVLGIFRADAALDGVAALEEVFLPEAQRLAHGHAELFLHEVNAHHLLGYGVLNLQAGVHLEEIEVAVLVDEELYGARAAVVDGLGCGHGLLAHLLAELRGEERRGAFLDDFLVAALHGALTVVQVYDVAVGVAKDLELYMVGFLDKFLKVNGVVTKG